TSADVDGDGHADLVVADNASNTISVLLNQGNGTFGAPVQYGVGVHPVFVTSADMDGDGDADLAAANFNSNTVSVLRNCHTSGRAFCSGDGSGNPCPCGNDSTPGANGGCLNSLGRGGTLRGSG